MKITPMGRIFLFLVLGLVAFFVVKHFIPSDSPEIAKQEGGTPVVKNEVSVTSSKVPDVASENRKIPAFNYTPENPVNGTLKGVVEVGATGFNSFIIKMDKQHRWKVLSKDFGKSLAYEKLATTDDIRIGLKNFFAKMFDQGVESRNMHFVISSGAQKEPKTLIISNELKKMRYVVNLVTAEQEGKFALKATIPQIYQANSFLLDIGSGTTKISWKEGDRLIALEASGAKYYEKGKSDSEIYDELKRKAATVSRSKTNTCFIIGGVPYTLSEQSKTNKEERFTVLKEPSNYKAVDKKMASGLNIYKAVADATGCNKFVFDADANFTIGFLLSLPSKD